MSASPISSTAPSSWPTSPHEASISVRSGSTRSGSTVSSCSSARNDRSPACEIHVSSVPTTGTFKIVLLLRPPGVYRADSDTSLLIHVLRGGGSASDRRFLEMGTGTGALALQQLERAPLR